MPTAVMGVTTVLPAACAGFLLAVLWMDLIFDAQVVAHRRAGEDLPESVLASIAGYYHRATTSSRPMSTLDRGGHGRSCWPRWRCGRCAVTIPVGWSPRRPCWPVRPILLALIRTVPNAVRLGRRADTPAVQSRLARSIFRDHLLCFGLMLAFLGVWLAAVSLGL